MKKSVGVLIGLVILAVVAWYLLTNGEMTFGSAKKKLMETAQDVVAANAAPEDVAALAMKAINLTQGEKGLELWRLKAEWGNLRRRDNIMELEKPRFTYYMPSDGTALTVHSASGDISQEEQKIRFVDSVVATYEENTLLAPEMIYMGKSREIICPRGGRVNGRGFWGSAETINWQMSNNILEASGSVDVFLDNEMFAREKGPEKTQTQPARRRP